MGHRGKSGEWGELTNWEARGGGTMLGEVTLWRVGGTNKSGYQKKPAQQEELTFCWENEGQVMTS